LPNRHPCGLQEINETAGVLPKITLLTLAG